MATNSYTEIDLSEYSLADEEKEMGAYVDILNIYNIYFKTLFGKNQEISLFDGIDNDNPVSTNRALENLFEAIEKHKNSSDEKYIKLFNPSEYRDTYLKENSTIPEDHPFYMVNIDKEEFVTHNLISAITHIAEYDWRNIHWSINQINEF